MHAVHLENSAVTVLQQPDPVREPGFAVLRLRLAGICNTDLELQRGYYGFSGTPGHEFVAEVIEADNQELIGRRVVGEINLACGHCEWCARGLGRHCPTRRVLGIVNYPGAFRELITLPESNLHIVPDNVSDAAAVFAEPLAAAGEILDQVDIAKGTEVALLGDGKLGLLIAAVLQAHGAIVHHYGRHANKLAHSPAAEKITSGRHPKAAYSFVIDATGSADGLATAVQMTQPRGTLILKSTVHGLVPLDTAPVIVNELTLIGSRCGRFEPALHWLSAHTINVEPLISDTFPLTGAPAAFQRARERGVLKVLLRN